MPLALRALELWHEVERETKQTLFSNTGVLTIGKADSEIVTGALQSARQHGIAHELLSAADTVKRFPAFVPPIDAIGVFEPTGGVLFADLCIGAHLQLARATGASIHTGEVVTSIDWSNRHSTVVHTASSRYSAKHVIVAAGAWAPKLLGLEHAFRVTRETVHWFDTNNTDANAPQCPVSLIAMDNGKMFYGIPNFGDGYKAGLHHTGLMADPNVQLAQVDADERAEVSAAVAKHVPAGAGPVRESAHCYYTTTADFHFAIGALPWAESVTLAAACSGHGFKFATALGEALAQSIRGEPNLLPADVFNVGRLGASTLAT